uniref:Chromo domain-containing protein n=1 Tax=Panagrolaimus davidi TaxID=227884 RepID=A0A914QKT9_9BILA
MYYLITWKNYYDEDWVKESDLDCNELIKKFKKKPNHIGDYYLVEFIIGHRKINDQFELYVKWKNYDHENAVEWIEYKQMVKQQMLEEYETNFMNH